MTELTGKHVVISGGGTGVGSELARQFADANAKITIIGRREAPLLEVFEKTGAFVAPADVTDRNALEQALGSARGANGPVDIAIANAGSAISKPFSELSSEDMSEMLDVNLMGTFNLWQACLNDMRKSNWGRLISIASTAGIKGYSYVTAYCAAKHGVVGMTRSLALETAKTNITVNAICPGFVNTPLLQRSIDNIVSKTGMTASDAEKNLKRNNPQDRFIETDEVAATAIWLASEAARSVNGQAISINGGEQ